MKSTLVLPMSDLCLPASGVNHASLVQITIQTNDGQTLDVYSQMPMTTAGLYKRVLEEAKDVSVDIPVPTPNVSIEDNIAVLEYTLPTLASMFVIKPLDVEYSKLTPAVIQALHVNSYHEAPVFELINRAYTEKMGHEPHKHLYFKKLNDTKFHINSNRLVCMNKQNSFDEESMRTLTDNNMLEVFDYLYRQLAEMEFEDPDRVCDAIRHQVDKVNMFYKQVYDEQRERLRTAKQQTDELMRAVSLQIEREKDEQRAQLNQRARFAPPPPPSTSSPALHPGKGSLMNRMMNNSNAHQSSTSVPVQNPHTAQLLQSLPRTTGRLNGLLHPVQQDPVVIKKSAPASLKDRINAIRQSASEQLVAELEPAPLPIVDCGVTPPTPTNSRSEFLQRMKRMQAEREPPVVSQHVADESQQHHPIQSRSQPPEPVVNPRKQAFLNKFKEREQARLEKVF